MSLKSTFTVLLIGGLTAFTQEQSSPIDVFHREGDQGQYEYYALNTQPCPYQVEVAFDVLQNLEASVELPYFKVIYPDAEPQLLFDLNPLRRSATRFSSQHSLAKGDPEAKVEMDYAYWLPYKAGESAKLLQGYNGSYSHQGSYSLDFDLTAGTGVYASRAGVVLEVKADSDEGGPDPSFKTKGNYITIFHADGSFADYYHLQLNGAAVKPGDSIAAGQLIGYSGDTGWADGPHLHFQVYKATRMGIQTLPVNFQQAEGKVISPKEKEVYKSYHPVSDQ
ncbi:MAG: M23 family metallopeptidase [Cyclobacteriaceae bacterium]